MESDSMLSPDSVLSFSQNGFVVVRSVVELRRIKELRAAHDELVVRWAAECEVSVDEYERVVSQWTNLHEQHPSFHAQIHHPQVIAISQNLLGVKSLQLFHDHLISKPPNRSSTIPWHQDYPYWPVDKPKALSCWLALDDVGSKTGGMQFMPGAHLEGEKAPVDFLHSPKDWGERINEAEQTRLKAGDCLFHSCLSWHTSPPNQSSRPRRAFISIMMSDECRWDPDHSDWHPMNDYVTVASGEQFNRDRFPVLGETG